MSGIEKSRIISIMVVLVAGVLLAPTCPASGLDKLCGTYIYSRDHAPEHDIYAGRLMMRFDGISNNSPVRVMLHTNQKLFYIYPMPGGTYCVKSMDLNVEDHRNGRIIRSHSSAATAGVHMFGWNGKTHVRKRIYRDWGGNLVVDDETKQWQVVIMLPIPMANTEETTIKLIRADKGYRDEALEAFIQTYDFDADVQNPAAPSVAPPSADPYGLLKSNLYSALFCNHLEKFKKHLQQHPDFSRNDPDYLFDGPAITYRPEYVAALLKSGFDVNSRSKDGIPLIVFIMNRARVNTEQLLPILLRWRVNVNVCDDDGLTALHLAKTAPQVTMLLEAGADAVVYSGEGARPIDTLISHGGGTNAARLLIDAMPDNQPLGNTPGLVAAAHSGNAGMIQLLLSNGADINSTDDRGWTALHGISSVYWGGTRYIEPLNLLLDAGAVIDVCARDGSTPLLKAVAAENCTVASILLEHGANPHAVNDRGMTPFTESGYHDNKPMRKLLRKWKKQWARK